MKLLLLLLCCTQAQPAWWDAAWKHRRRLALKNNLEGGLKAGHPVQIEFDAAYLGIREKAAPDLKDLVLVHAGKPIPFALGPGRGETSRAIWFRTAADLAAGAGDDGYALYYGNPAAAPAAAPLGSILDFHEDFSSPDGLRAKFESDRDLSLEVREGALLVRDVAAERTEQTPARLKLRAAPSSPGFALSFDLEVDPRAATPAAVSLVVDLKEPGVDAPDAAKKLDGLIERLGDNDWQVREKATKELIAIGRAAAAKLAAAARADDAEVRWRAEHILREIRDKGQSPTLSAGVRTGDGVSARPVSLVSQIRASRSREGQAAGGPAKFRITLLRDPDGAAALLWNGGSLQTGKLPGEVHEIYFAVHKGGPGAFEGIRIDNVSLRRHVDDEHRPTHTLDVEETRQ